MGKETSGLGILVFMSSYLLFLFHKPYADSSQYCKIRTIPFNEDNSRRHSKKHKKCIPSEIIYQCVTHIRNHHFIYYKTVYIEGYQHFTISGGKQRDEGVMHRGYDKGCQCRRLSSSCC